MDTFKRQLIQKFKEPFFEIPNDSFDLVRLDDTQLDQIAGLWSRYLFFINNCAPDLYGRKNEFEGKTPAEIKEHILNVYRTVNITFDYKFHFDRKYRILKHIITTKTTNKSIVYFNIFNIRYQDNFYTFHLMHKLYSEGIITDKSFKFNCLGHDPVKKTDFDIEIEVESSQVFISESDITRDCYNSMYRVYSVAYTSTQVNFNKEAENMYNFQKLYTYEVLPNENYVIFTGNSPYSFIDENYQNHFLNNYFYKTVLQDIIGTFKLHKLMHNFFIKPFISKYPVNTFYSVKGFDDVLDIGMFIKSDEYTENDIKRTVLRLKPSATEEEIQSVISKI